MTVPHRGVISVPYSPIGIIDNRPVEVQNERKERIHNEIVRIVQESVRIFDKPVRIMDKFVGIVRIVCKNILVVYKVVYKSIRILYVPDFPVVYYELVRIAEALVIVAYLPVAVLYFSRIVVFDFPVPVVNVANVAIANFAAGVVDIRNIRIDNLPVRVDDRALVRAHNFLGTDRKNRKYEKTNGKQRPDERRNQNFRCFHTHCLLIMYNSREQSKIASKKQIVKLTVCSSFDILENQPFIIFVFS